MTVKHFDNSFVATMLCTCTYVKPALAGPVGACKWGVGAQARCVGSKLPLNLTPGLPVQ